MGEWIAQYGVTGMGISHVISLFANVCFLLAALGRYGTNKRYTLAQLGPMLLEERLRRRVTQITAAAECGVRAFGKYERGRTVQSIEDLGKLATFLGKEARDFV